MPWDIVGLPEFFVDTIRAEAVPETGLVRLYCGARRHNEVIHWLYSAVMPADAIIIALAETKAAAEKAWNDAQFALIEEKRH